MTKAKIDNGLSTMTSKEFHDTTRIYNEKLNNAYANMLLVLGNKVNENKKALLPQDVYDIVIGMLEQEFELSWNPIIDGFTTDEPEILFGVVDWTGKNFNLSREANELVRYFDIANYKAYDNLEPFFDGVQIEANYA